MLCAHASCSCCPGRIYNQRKKRTHSFFGLTFFLQIKKNVLKKEIKKAMSFKGPVKGQPFLGPLGERAVPRNLQMSLAPTSPFYTTQNCETYSGAYCLFDKDSFYREYSKLSSKYNGMRVVVPAATAQRQNQASPQSRFFVGFGFCKGRPWILPGTVIQFVDEVSGRTDERTEEYAGQQPTTSACNDGHDEGCDSVFYSYADAAPKDVLPCALSGSRRVATVAGMVVAEGKREMEFAVSICFEEPVLASDASCIFKGCIDLVETEDEASLREYILKFPVYYNATWGYLPPELRCNPAAAELNQNWDRHLNQFKVAAQHAVDRVPCLDLVQYVNALACVDGLGKRGFRVQRTEDEEGNGDSDDDCEGQDESTTGQRLFCRRRTSNSSSIRSVSNGSSSHHHDHHDSQPTKRSSKGKGLLTASGGRGGGVSLETVGTGEKGTHQQDSRYFGPTATVHAGAAETGRKPRAARVLMPVLNRSDNRLVSNQQGRDYLPRGHIPMSKRSSDSSARCIHQMKERSFYVGDEDHSELMRIVEKTVLSQRDGIEKAFDKYTEGFKSTCSINPVAVPAILNAYESFMRSECGAAVCRNE